MVRQIRKRKERFAPISQRQLRESKEEEEEEVSRVENVCCSTSNYTDMSTRKRRREEVSDSTREEGENSVEENGATPRKQRKYDSAAETGHSAAQQRGRKRKYTEEPECESPMVKKRTVQSSSEVDDDTTRKQSRSYTARETGHSAAQRGKKRKFPAETECESPVVKKRTVQSSSEVDDDTTRKQSRSYTARETGHSAAQRGKKRKFPAETECESPVVKKRTVQSSSEVDDDTTRKQSRSYTARETGHSAAQRGKKRKFPAETECESPVVKKRTVQSSSEEDGETLSRYYTARETVQHATEQKGKKRKSTEEPECESPVTKKGRTDKAGVSGTTSTHSTKSKECETASLCPEDFIFHKILGEGDIKKVVLATHRDSGRLVAVKIVHKSYPTGNEPAEILNERIALEKAGGSLFCDHAYATFQTENHLFFVLNYMRGGDLINMLETMGMLDYSIPFELPMLKLLAAELVCGLQHLHSRGIVHRDIKIDNILIDRNGHVKIADYGIAVTNVYGYNMVTEYLGFMLNGAPEMMFELPYDGAVDYFALGVLLFKLIFPLPLYNGRYGNPKNIMYEVPSYPDDADPDLKDLLEKLLCKDPCRRNDFIADIQDHPFFNGINWKELEAGEAPPPFFVQRKGFRNLTRETIKPEDLMNNIDKWGIPIKPISAEKQKIMFDGFSFVSDEWKAMQKLK